MNITVTLIVQMLVFAIFIWVVMKFIWPIILGAMNEREQKIAAGLAAAEQGQKDLSEAKSRADEVIKEARTRALAIESQARTQANQIIDEARKVASLEGEKALASAKSQIELESNRARDQLRGQVVSLAVAGAKRVLEREVDAKAHGDDRRTLIQAEKKAVAEVKVIDEPVTIVVSLKGWVRALKGHEIDAATLAFKAGDSLYGTFPCRSGRLASSSGVEQSWTYWRNHAAAARC